MKILFACYFSIPHVGGVNRYIETLKKELEEHGHQVDILAHHSDMKTIYKISYTPNEFGRSLVGNEINKSTNNQENRYTIKDVIDHQLYQYYTKNLPHVDPEIRWREIERYTFEVAAAILKLEDYDLIHTHDILSTRALWRAKPDHVPLVATIHGIVATEYLNSGVLTSRESLRWKYAAAEEYYGHMSTDATIVSTNWQTAQLINHFGVPQEKITVIPYGLDLVPFVEKVQYEPYPPLKAEQVHADKIIIACPARLVPEKDHKTLLEALHRLKQERDDFVCWLIGDGTLRDEIELQAKKWGVRDHLIFFGDRFDIPALLRLSDIVVLASIQDMHPYTLMEAQIAGKPCVASDAGGIPEVVRDKETGLIFETGNSAQLAEKLLALLRNPALRSQLGTNAAARGSVHYSSKTLLEKTVNVYLQAIEAKKSRNEHPVEKPDLAGKYGFINIRSGQDDPAASIFACELDQSKFDTSQWSAIIRNLPADYSIPDSAFIQILAERECPPFPQTD